MDDLSSSPFFDNQILNLLSSIINNYGLPKAVITGAEKKMVERADEIRELDAELDRSLRSVITNCSSHVSVVNALFFLLTARRMDMLGDAREALEAAVTEGRHMDRSGLQRLLREAKDMPMSWAVLALGDEGEDRNKRRASIHNPGINVAKMRDQMKRR